MAGASFGSEGQRKTPQDLEVLAAMVSDRRLPCVFNDYWPRGQGRVYAGLRAVSSKSDPAAGAQCAGRAPTSELTGRNTACFSPSAALVVHRASLTRMLRKSLMVFLSL